MIKRNEVYLIEDFQEFGEVLFVPLKRITKNVHGGKLSNPIWEGLIIDAMDKRLRDIWHRRISEDIYFMALSFERNLKELKKQKGDGE